jgi:hypothetical protein
MLVLVDTMLLSVSVTMQPTSGMHLCSTLVGTRYMLVMLKFLVQIMG